MHELMNILMHGLLNLPWWGYLAVTLVFTQITIFGVTIYLHRCQAHRSVELHPAVSHFFRLWLWMTTGMETKQWTAIHRKHHAKVETAEDPHSPQVKGIKKVMWEGAELYRKECRNQETMDRYGEGTPDDWMEKNVYTKHSAMGIMIMMAINLLLFGPIGLSIWAIQMAWIPFWAAGFINGVGHWFGYRNFEVADASRNISFWGLIVGGEELHNNHHTYATSAKFSVKWWEFDIGWMVIRTLQIFGLATPKRVPPRPLLVEGKTSVDIDTVKAILTNRFLVMARYSRAVIMPVLREESRRAGQAGSALLHRMRKVLVSETSLVKESDQQQLATVLENYGALNVVYQFRLKLQNIWARGTASQKELVESLQEWCRQAEATGIVALKDFVHHLKTYMPQPGLNSA
jgi:stearoyl-CoA desaturase (delta-9 desaturase)